MDNRNRLLHIVYFSKDTLEQKKNIMLKTNMNYVKEKIYMVIIITKDTYYKNTYQVNTKNCSDLTYSSQRTFTKKNLFNVQLF